MRDDPGNSEHTLRTSRGEDLRPGIIIGDRYRLEERLGEGGMGEVWLTFDLKLSVEIALKRLHTHLLQDSNRAKMLRHEVRAARDVTSPHVCRIYDLVESDLGEMISMEYVDGWSLSHLLTERGPLDLAEAADIASQMLSGLGAIHAADLIHRDLKPANVMITRSGRTVLMDFGVARFVDATQGRSIAGTPAYMAPEQMRGGELDTRCDIYALGIILAEMSSAEALSTLDERRALWERLHADPPRVKGPWQALIMRCLATDPDRRFASTAECARALEESLYRTGELDEEDSPYPGLSTFTEKDARFFFGRELEVEQAWKKLQRTPMVSVIGPSGVGKSSFVNAGLLPAAPTGWDCIRCAPGRSPALSLAEALSTRFESDADAMRQLLHFEDADAVVRLAERWRRQYDEVLLVLDQFEELFTQSPEEVQIRFAQLLGRLNLEADIHVLVCTRDDFFFLCHRYDELAPLFFDPLPLTPLSGDDLRRALVQPAQLSGYHFESASLVEDMLEPVSKERGALPLMAFAAARLWERRSRSKGQLTREAYDSIGGVEGALAQHAEKVMERIGVGREDFVREIFRNLVTAHGTRVAREREELLSVFEDQENAAAVLDGLISSRLLISYDLEDENGEARHEVEIIHESMLSAWPRLVRWQTQDADGAQLRDQFRQAAHLWEEKSRSDDLLWSGTAYQEFELWRDRYEGSLSDTEDAFAESMVAHENRRKRRRKIAVSSVFVVLLLILGVVSKLKLDADAAAHRADTEKRQAIAARFENLGREALETDNSRALAFAIAGLGQVDRPGLRMLALEALWKGPTRFYPPGMRDLVGDGGSGAFSPDGKWLVAGGQNAKITAWPSDGTEPISTSHTGVPWRFTHDGSQLLAARDADRSASARRTQLSLISFPDAETLWSVQADSLLFPGALDDESLVMGLYADSSLTWERWSLDGGQRTRLGTVPADKDQSAPTRASGDARMIIWARANEVLLSRSDELASAPPSLVGTLEDNVRTVGTNRSGNLISASTRYGMTSIWALDTDRPPRRLLKRRLYDVGPWTMDIVEDRGWLLATVAGRKRLHWLEGPASSVGTTLLPGYGYPTVPIYPRDPSSAWVVFSNTQTGGYLWFYPLSNLHPHHLRSPEWEASEWRQSYLSPDGRHLVQVDGKEVYLVDLETPELQRRYLFTDPVRVIFDVGFSPERDRLALGAFMGGAWVVSLRDGSVLHLDEAAPHTSATAFSLDGQFLATGGGWAAGSEQGILKIFDTTGHLIQELGPCHEVGHAGDRFEQINRLVFLDETTLLSGCSSGAMLWDLASGTARSFHEGYLWKWSIAVSEHYFVTTCDEGIALYDRPTLERQILEFPNPSNIHVLAMAPDEDFVVAGYRPGGALRVRHFDEDSSHLLLRLPSGASAGMHIDPHGRWILASTSDGQLSYWPVPRGRPLHDRPLDEFLAVLKAQTNLRIVPDFERATGYRHTESTFPGWETVPTWQEWNSEEYMADPPWIPMLPREDLQFGANQ